MGSLLRAQRPMRWMPHQEAQSDATLPELHITILQDMYAEGALERS